jgi:Stress responsive A/B Barrel Domain
MIAHTVLFQPGPSVGPETKAAILESLTRAIQQCPTVRASRIGRRIRHGLPGYEQQMREDYQYLLVLEFDDIEGLRAYLEHPAHNAIGGFFTSAASASLAYDYETVELSEAGQLL